MVKCKMKKRGVEWERERLGGRGERDRVGERERWSEVGFVVCGRLTQM